MLVVVTRSPTKVITSVQRAGNGIQKMEVNGCNVSFVKNGFTKHVFTFKSSVARKQRIFYFIDLTVIHL